MFRSKRISAASRLPRKVALATLTTVGLSLLVMPGSAEAASYPSVQVKICNNNVSSDINVNIAGWNQNGQWVSSPTVWVGQANVTPLPCTTLQNWWWRTGTNVNVKYVDNKYSDGGTSTCYIPSSVQNGSTYTIYPVLGC